MSRYIYVYEDILSKNIVGCFVGTNDVETKRFLLTLCYEALEKSKFNLGALKIFCDRIVYKIDYLTMTKSKVFDMKELVHEAISFLKDKSHLIEIEDIKLEKKES